MKKPIDKFRLPRFARLMGSLAMTYRRLLLAVVSVSAGLLIFHLAATKVEAQNCPAACGQTWPGYYLCEKDYSNPSINPYTGETEYPLNCAWKNGCCSKCSETDCCGAPVGGGTNCGGTEPGTTPGPQPTAPPGQDPRCAGGCGYEGCGCACSEGDWGPWGACSGGWQVRYRNTCSQAEPLQDWQQCNSCSATGPAAPGLVGPANGSSSTYGNPISLSWYDAPDQSRGDRVFVPDGGCNRWRERNVNCRQECKKTNRRGECTRYDTVCDRETVCVDPSGYWTRQWYNYDWGKWNCVLSGDQDGQGSFAVYVNDQRLGTVAYAGDTLTANRVAGFTVAANQTVPGNNTWKIVAEADTGSADSAVWNFSLGAPPTPTPALVSVSGTVYSGQGGGLNKCIGSQQPIDPSVIASSKVTVNPDDQEGPVQGNGSYVVNQVLESGAKTITLSGMDPDYYCSCPGGCQYGANLQLSGATGWNFYVSNILSKWAQVVGGHVHGQTGARVEVPENNYFMIKGDFSNNPGAATKTTGSIATIPGQLSTTNWKLTDAIALSTWRYSYQRLWVRAGSPTSPLPGDDGYNKPPAGFYKKSGDLAIDGGWTGISGKTVIFVDGDVDIKTKITLAGDSDFFAVIASGDITVDPAVGHPVKANPGVSDADLAGVFLAGGNWRGCPIGCSTTKQLVVYGTIAADFGLAGTGRVNFNRDLGVGNNTGPGVAVIWNPNLLLNFPAQLTDAVTDWREVAP